MKPDNSNPITILYTSLNENQFWLSSLNVFPFKSFQHALLVILTMADQLIYVKGHFKTASHPCDSHIHRWHLLVYLLRNFPGLVLSHFQVTQGASPQGIAFTWLSKESPSPSSPHTGTRCQKAGGVDRRVGTRGQEFCLHFVSPLSLPKVLFSPATLHTHCSELKGMEEKQPSKSC